MTDRESRERLIELIKKAIKEWDVYFGYSLSKGERSKTYEKFIADRLLANGVVVLDWSVVTPKNRPLITHIAGMPLNDVLDLIRAKKEGRLIETPCKVGQTVWEVDTETPFDEELQVIESKVERFFVGTSHNLHSIDSKTVFLTKEEAEAKMKERE